MSKSSRMLAWSRKSGTIDLHTHDSDRYLLPSLEPSKWTLPGFWLRHRASSWDYGFDWKAEFDKSSSPQTLLPFPVLRRQTWWSPLVVWSINGNSNDTETNNQYLTLRCGGWFGGVKVSTDDWYYKWSHNVRCTLEVHICIIGRIGLNGSYFSGYLTPECIVS